MIRTSIFLTPEQMEKIRELPGTLSSHIRTALEMYFKWLDKKGMSVSSSNRKEAKNG